MHQAQHREQVAPLASNYMRQHAISIMYSTPHLIFPSSASPYIAPDPNGKLARFSFLYKSPCAMIIDEPQTLSKQAVISSILGIMTTNPAPSRARCAPSHLEKQQQNANHQSIINFFIIPSPAPSSLVSCRAQTPQVSVASIAFINLGGGPTSYPKNVSNSSMTPGSKHKRAGCNKMQQQRRTRTSTETSAR